MRRFFRVSLSPRSTRIDPPQSPRSPRMIGGFFVCAGGVAVITVVTGPPCSGKSTYASERHRPGDILIDFDLLAQALGSPVPHEHPEPIRWVTMHARRAAIQQAIYQHKRGAKVWIVQTTLSRAELTRYHAVGAEIITLGGDPVELHARAERERPARWHELIDGWRPVRESRAVPIDRRGRQGRPWRRMRAAVLAASDVCWICGHQGADSVDHLHPLARGGSALDPSNLAPAHHNPCPTCGRRCNASRGAGRGVDPEQGVTTQGYTAPEW